MKPATLKTEPSPTANEPFPRTCFIAERKSRRLFSAAASLAIMGVSVTAGDAVTVSVQDLCAVGTSHFGNHYRTGQDVVLEVDLVAPEARTAHVAFALKNPKTSQPQSRDIVLDDAGKAQARIPLGMLPAGQHVLDYTVTVPGRKLGSGTLTIAVSAAATPSRARQMDALRRRTILVPTWGWTYQEMGAAARRFGYDTLSAPGGNKVDPDQVKFFLDQGLSLILRPGMPVTDPFDPQDIDAAIALVRPLVERYEAHPGILGFNFTWGVYGEGGFRVPPRGNYQFTEKAREAFNLAMGTPGVPLPEKPGNAEPAPMRYIKWIEFRQKTLSAFRARYVAAFKNMTPKLIGTWSEIYPVVLYDLNMGDAAGADFLNYDLSFGDVAYDQRIALAETHGSMQHYADFETWRKFVMPLVAKGYGEGVTPMGFQFPMRKGHTPDSLATKCFVERIEDEYALKICPDYQRLMRRPVKFRPAQVALVYQSYGAAAFPQDSDAFNNIYHNGAVALEAMLHMAGTDLRALPLEKLATENLDAYKLIIIPDAMYLTAEMVQNLSHTQARVLVTGDYLRAYWDGKKYTEDTAWGQSKTFADFEIGYGAVRQGPLRLVSSGPLAADLKAFDGLALPEDRLATYGKLPADSQVILACGDTPLLITAQAGRFLHLTSRLFGLPRGDQNPELNRLAFQILRNVLTHAGVQCHIANPMLANPRTFVYGPYGCSNNILWNQTDQDLELDWDGKRISVPKHGWVDTPAR